MHSIRDQHSQVHKQVWGEGLDAQLGGVHRLGEGLDTQGREGSVGVEGNCIPGSSTSR